jgi:hypothetical protein
MRDMRSKNADIAAAAKEQWDYWIQFDPYQGQNLVEFSDFTCHMLKEDYMECLHGRKQGQLDLLIKQELERKLRLAKAANDKEQVEHWRKQYLILTNGSFAGPK